ncbi:hypothetical protein EI534_29060 [Pseudomonas frederiksbergensis]|nr:hypothetical protein [Pseudomonas frederiksbergensis]
MARGLAPVGLRSGPKTCNRGVMVLRLLRSRTGASPLATEAPTMAAQKIRNGKFATRRNSS